MTTKSLQNQNRSLEQKHVNSQFFFFIFPHRFSCYMGLYSLLYWCVCPFIRPSSIGPSPFFRDYEAAACITDPVQRHGTDAAVYTALLVAYKWLDIRVCPSVRPSVGGSVGCAFFFWNRGIQAEVI